MAAWLRNKDGFRDGNTVHEIIIIAVHDHPRGKLYEVQAKKKSASLLLTFHVLGRINKWRLTVQAALRTLLYPEEVLRGHRGRFIAHRRTRGHVLRVIYEYEADMPVVVTVYNPVSERYFQGRGTYEDRILS